MSGKNKKSALLGGITFFSLFLILILLFTLVDMHNVDTRGLLFLMSFLSCFLTAIVVYYATFKKNRPIRLSEKIIDNISVSSKELYTELYKNSPVPYMIIDFEGHIASANLAASRILGFSQSKVQGINIFEQLRGESSDHFDMLIEKYKSKIPVSDETVRIMRREGKDGWGLLSIYHFMSSYGDHMGILTLVDISKQKQIENAKSEFVSLASHQLRTPIAGIKWSAELLELDADAGLNEKQKKYIERILIGVNRMAVLVDDFLRVSRFELGTFQPEFVTVDVPALINNVITEQASRAVQKKIETKLFLDETANEIVTDQNLLRMMITNLYSNAVKYTKEGGTVHVGYKVNGQSIVFSVADNGMGIPIADQEYIFSKLYRASNAVRNVPDGTGLGLYIIREAVEVLKGKVSFTSVENVGSTFEISLPLVLPDIG